jgi:hypothetical protein
VRDIRQSFGPTPFLQGAQLHCRDVRCRRLNRLFPLGGITVATRGREVAPTCARPDIVETQYSRESWLVQVRLPNAGKVLGDRERPPTVRPLRPKGKNRWESPWNESSLEIGRSAEVPLGSLQRLGETPQGLEMD